MASHATSERRARRRQPQRSCRQRLAPLWLGIALLAAAPVADGQQVVVVADPAVVTVAPSGTGDLRDVDAGVQDAGDLEEDTEGVFDIVKWAMGHADKVGGVLVSLTIVLVILGTWNIWMPLVYDETCGLVHFPRFRNIHPLVGRCTSSCCGFCVPPYHDPFRLRIVVHEGMDVKGDEVYVQVICGNNPPKSTSVVEVRLDNSRYPVVWNEPLEIEVTTADENIYVQLIESDGRIHGVVNLSVQEFTKRLEGNADEVQYLKDWTTEQRVLNGKRYVGTLKLSLFVTPPGRGLTTALAHDGGHQYFERYS